MNMKTLALTFVLGFSLINLTPTIAAHAKEKVPSPQITHETQGHLDIITYSFNNPISYDFQNYKTGIRPMYIPYDGTEYEVSTKTLYKDKSWGTVITNNSSTSDSVSRTISRTKFANGSIGLSAESAVNWRLIQGKIGINGEISWGKSKTISVTYTWNIPPYTRTTISTGSKAVKTYGNIVRYSHGREITRKAVHANYSYDDYADKTSKRI